MTVGRAAVFVEPYRFEITELPPVPVQAGGIRVKVTSGGICGSDLHYFHHYRMGDFPVREPFVLWHEAAGTVEAIGSSVTDFEIGDMVTINPSHPCHECYYCLTGKELLCAEMRFLGSSRKFPHIQGIFSETFETDQSQCFKWTRCYNCN